jgi:hypothetical protein
MYAFMRREVARSLPTPKAATKATLESRLAAYLSLQDIAPGLRKATHRWGGTTIAAILVYVGAFGAWLPEATDWGGLVATWWWLLLALVLTACSVWLHLSVLTLQAQAIAQLREQAPQTAATLPLYGDGRWYAQLLSTGKYLLAAIGCLSIGIICILVLW